MQCNFKLKLAACLLLRAFLFSMIRCDDGSGEELADEAQQEEVAVEEPWIEDPDYGQHHVEWPCAFSRQDLKEIKEELGSLRTAVNEFRAKLDPDFEGPSKEIAKSKCPKGFHFLPKVRSCYKVIYEELNWTSADMKCRDLTPDAHLVAITTSQESQVLQRYLTWDLDRNPLRKACRSTWGGRMLWTSGQRRNETVCLEPFVWKLSPNQFEPLTYTKWRAEEPNCAENNEHCLHIVPSELYSWNDISCDYEMCSLCEYDPK